MKLAPVIAVLPRSGLGNRLLVWARAEAFAHRHGLRCVTLGWGKLNLGPFLRREQTKRLYGSSFQSQPIEEAIAQLKVASGAIHWDPDFNAPLQPGAQYGFRADPHWADYFKDIRESRANVAERLREIVQPSVWEAVGRQPVPTIGVHVRRGDFAELPPGTDFAQVGLTRTPLDYFVAVVDTLRKVAGSPLPVTLFSDGKDEELAPLLQLDAVRRSPKNPDLVDLLLLSRSCVIVASAGSTFSMWAGFLSDAPLLLHPDHIHAPIRPLDISARVFEGPGPTRLADVHPLLAQEVEALVPASSHLGATS